MIVSSFSDPITLICPPMVGKPLLQSICKAFRGSNTRVVCRVFEDNMRYVFCS